MKKIILIAVCALLVSCNLCGMSVSHENEVRVTDKPSHIDPSEYNSFKSDFGLRTIIPVDDAAGSLTPRYPMAMGEEWKKHGNCIYYKGCTVFRGYTLIVKTGDGYRIARNQDNLKKLFAPIETREEALGYAVISTGLQPVYSFDIKKNFRTFVGKINGTYSIETDKGYEVNLFKNPLCGCGPHPHVMVRLHVGRNGDLKKIETAKIYEDPDQDGLCVDD